MPDSSSREGAPFPPRSDGPAEDRPDAGDRNCRVTVEVPPELLDELARQVAELIELETADPERWVKTADAAEHLGCTPQRIYDLISGRTSNIPYRREGRSLRFRLSDLDAWLGGEGADHGR